MHCYHLLKFLFLGSSTMANCSLFHEASEKITYFSFSSQGIFSYVVRFFLSFLCTYFFPACMALTLQLSRSSCCLRICFSKADFFCVSSSYLSETVCLLAYKLHFESRQVTVKVFFNTGTNPPFQTCFLPLSYVSSCLSKFHIFPNTQF